MIDEDEIVFNEGSNLEDRRVFYEFCNSWDEPIFFVDYGEFGSGIIYDDQKEDVRYSVIFSYRDDCRDPDVHIGSGKSLREGEYHTHVSKTTILYRSGYHMADFLVFNKSHVPLPSSREKFLGMMRRFIKLKAFL